MMHTKVSRSFAAAAALALTLAACGGEADPETPETEVEQPAEDEPAEDEPAEDEEPADETAEDETAAPAGCTPDELALLEAGQLTVGTGDPVFPPWMLNDDPAGGEGFENGIVYALAEELGFAAEDVVWVSQTFDETIAPGPKDFDFAIQQISVTEDRDEVVDFSMVYYQPDKALITLPDSPIADATTFEELLDANWGATIGTTDLDYIEGIIGVEEGEVAVFDDQAGTFQALTGGQIDATVAAFPTALFATAVQVPEAQISAVLPADPNDTGHGLLFEEGNELVDCVDQALQAIIDAGVVDELTEEYLVGDADVVAITE